MKKKLILAISLICLNGCVGIAYKKSYFLERKSERRELEHENVLTSKAFKFDGDRAVYVSFPNRCNSIGLFGFIVPIVPVWSFNKCEELIVKITSNFSNQKLDIEIEDGSKIYESYKYDQTSKNYFFLVKQSEIKKAYFVIRSNGEKMRIPFEYGASFYLFL